MAATYAELVTQLTNAIKYVEIIYQTGSTVGDDLLAQEDALIQAFEGSAKDTLAKSSGLSEVRSGIAAALEAAGSLIEPHILAFKDLVDSSGTDAASVFDDLYDYFITNNKTVNARNFSRGSFSADGSNTGVLDIKRCTVDENGHLIENTFSQVITAKVVANTSGGLDGAGITDRGKELIQVKGQGASDDALDLEVSGKGTDDSFNIACATSDGSLPNNASFGSYTGTGSAITAITDWAVTNSIGNFEQDTTNFFREDSSEGGTPAGLRITGTDTISQALTVGGGSLDFSRPYFTKIHFNRTPGTASGTLQVDCGSVNVSVAVSAQAGFTELAIPPGQNSWPSQWEEDVDTDFKVGWTQTTDYIVVDDLVIEPFTQFDNHWLLPIGGATELRINDKGTITDTEAGAIIQRWLWRTLQKYLPSENTGSESESDPSVSF